MVYCHSVLVRGLEGPRNLIKRFQKFITNNKSDYVSGFFKNYCQTDRKEYLTDEQPYQKAFKDDPDFSKDKYFFAFFLELWARCIGFAPLDTFSFHYFGRKKWELQSEKTWITRLLFNELRFITEDRAEFVSRYEEALGVKAGSFKRLLRGYCICKAIRVLYGTKFTYSPELIIIIGEIKWAHYFKDELLKLLTHPLKSAEDIRHYEDEIEDMIHRQSKETDEEEGFNNA